MAEPQSSFDGQFLEIYDWLRDRAARILHFEASPEITLRPTELTDEVYLRLRAAPRARSEGELRGISARICRQVLVDTIRRRRAAKRGGGWNRTTLSSLTVGGAGPPSDLLDLDDAMSLLQQKHPRQHDVVEMRIFGGYSFGEIGEALAIRADTAQTYFRHARAVLKRALDSRSDPPGDCERV